MTNTLDGPHAFAIPNVVDSGPIDPGETVRVEFVAPPAGTYLYLDPTRAPIARAMGLAGAFVSLPAEPGPTPYDPSRTAEIDQPLRRPRRRRALPRRSAWDPARTWIWVFSSFDPVAQQRAFTDPDLAPAAFVQDYLPRYFAINGRTGYFASKDPATALHGRVGQPALIRVVNAGMATHSPHVHGNHVYLLAENGVVRDNLLGVDTFEMVPMATTDVLLPFIRPPDAWPWPPSDPDVWTTDVAGDGTEGMVFAMHCHTELSLLAGGGNYPQGLITHWVLTGDLPAGTDPGDTEEPAPDPAPPVGTEPPSAPPPVAPDPPPPAPTPRRPRRRTTDRRRGR